MTLSLQREHSARLLAHVRVLDSLPQPDRADPAERHLPEDGDGGLGALLGRRHLARGGGFLPVQLRGLAGRGRGQRGVRICWWRGCWCDTGFPGKRLVDALVDLPFALPTAVAGIALTTLYTENGWIGGLLKPFGITGGLHAAGRAGGADLHRPAVRGAQRAAGAARTLDAEIEEAAASLGAGRWQTFRRVIFPLIRPALLTGFAMAFARALGEYGSVVFISGNMPMRTEITPLLIITRLEQYDYAGATAIAAGDAGGFVPPAAGHQPAAMAQPPIRGGQMRTRASRGPPAGCVTA